jgi:HK97 family phage major capsid protein
MSVMLRDKIDQQNRLWTRMQEIQRVAIDEKRDWTAEERTNWDAANAEIDTVSADIERLEKMRTLGDVDWGQARQGSGADAPESAPDTDESRQEAYGEAFGRWLRGGMDFCTSDQRQLMARNAAVGEQRAYQGITTPSLGGYLVPDGFRNTMTETLKAFGGLINFANVISTATGNPLSWPTNDDTGNVGAILDENTQITEQAATFGTKAVGAYTYTSKLVRVSLQLLQDNVFDLDNWLPRKLGERIGRAVADDLVNGTGTGEPTGALPTSVQGATVTAANFIDYDGAAGGHLGYNALVDLEHSIDPAYRALGDTRYIFADSTLKILRKYVDTTLRPIWNPVPVMGQPATLNGQPYSIDQAMPAATGTNKPIMFGNFNAGFLVRQALDVQAVRLTERYADYLQVGYFGFMRIDSVPDDTSAYKHLVLS